MDLAVVLAVFAGLVIGSMTWLVLTVQVARRFGCAMAIILGLTLIPATALLLGTVTSTVISTVVRVAAPGVSVGPRQGTPMPFRFLTPTPRRCP